VQSFESLNKTFNSRLCYSDLLAADFPKCLTLIFDFWKVVATGLVTLNGIAKSIYPGTASKGNPFFQG
jgi:hypothetical protein